MWGAGWMRVGGGQGGSWVYCDHCILNFRRGELQTTQYITAALIWSFCLLSLNNKKDKGEQVNAKLLCLSSDLSRHIVRPRRVPLGSEAIVQLFCNFSRITCVSSSQHSDCHLYYECRELYGYTALYGSSGGGLFTVHWEQHVEKIVPFNRNSRQICEEMCLLNYFCNDKHYSHTIGKTSNHPNTKSHRTICETLRPLRTLTHRILCKWEYLHANKKSQRYFFQFNCFIHSFSFSLARISAKHLTKYRNF